MICTFGDAVVDVIVALTRPLVADDDVPASATLTAGGQAANVAAWVVEMGAEARVVTRLGDDAGGLFVRDALRSCGVDVRGPERPGRTGTVVSLVAGDGTRTMASDRGDALDLTGGDLDPAWFAGCAWLHLSGYALLGPERADVAVEAATMARAAGAAISVDLSAATLVRHRGGAEVRARLGAVGAVLVFANQAEAAALGAVDIEVEQLIVKEGHLGASIHTPGGVTRVDAAAGAVRDPTGAGDAFAAGWLVGGVVAATDAATRCLRTTGAMPRRAAGRPG